MQSCGVITIPGMDGIVPAGWAPVGRIGSAIAAIMVREARTWRRSHILQPPITIGWFGIQRKDPKLGAVKRLQFPKAINMIMRVEASRRGDSQEFD